LAENAIAAAEETGNHKAVTDATLTMARAAVLSDRTDAALEMYERVATTLRDEGPRSRLSEVLTEWAEIVAATGDHQRAYTLTKEALGERSPH
jgi:hypothetical protein